jgi:predicted PurR-regulated permease PerM
MAVLNPEHGERRRVIETALALLLLAILIAATFRVLLPFVGVLTYAIILATALRGPYEHLERWLGGRRKLAAVVFGFIAVAIMVVPLIYLSRAVSDLVRFAEQWLVNAAKTGLPDLPQWVSSLPLVGDRAAAAWEAIRQDGLAVLQQYQHQIGGVARWLLDFSFGLLGAVIEILLGIVVAAALLAWRTQVLQPPFAIAARIAGPTGQKLLNAATRAVRGVAIGVVGTSLLEGLLAWIGFAIAGVPAAAALAAVVFFFALVQIGPLLVVLGVFIWELSQGQTAWAIFIIVWGVGALMTTDNIVKPILIARSGRLPMLVLFIGVVGGLAAWGFTGMFIGATTLAIFWTMIQAWLRPEGPAGAES